MIRRYSPGCLGKILDTPRSELQFQVVEDIHDLIEEAQNFCDPKHAFMALARLATVTSNASDTGQVGRAPTPIWHRWKLTRNLRISQLEKNIIVCKPPFFEVPCEFSREYIKTHHFLWKKPTPAGNVYTEEVWCEWISSIIHGKRWLLQTLTIWGA